MSFETIRYEVTDGVARLWLNRPDKMNSFTTQMHGELSQTLDLLEQDKQARVLIISGEGRGFCAGQDLADPAVRMVAGQKAPDLGAVVEAHYKPLILRLQALSIPTIAAINGVAAGAGVSLALACDLVIARQSASFMLAFSKVGLIPDTGATWFLPQRIGMGRAMGLALLAEKFTAQQAQDWGLIWQAVADEVFETSVNQLAQQLASAPTKALVRIRQAMQAAPNNNLAQQLSLEAGFMQELGWSHDYAEGVNAFLEKRAPRFTGE